jgi:16S rRNA (guanine527-N7)-methyltransferase
MQAVGSLNRPAMLDEVLELARSRGLLGDGPLTDQVAHSLGFLAAFGEYVGAGGSAVDTTTGPGPQRWMDLGSGGGLPGLVLASRWTRSQAAFLDARSRSATFLSEAVDALGWADRVVVIHARAEAVGRRADLRGGFDLVVARSFGPPAETAECAAPFLRSGGHLIVAEPPPGSEAIREEDESARWPAEALRALGQEPLGCWRGRFGYQVIRQVHACPERFPRRVGTAGKHPLYRVGRPPA